MLGARDIFIGVNAIDYSGYPDCRPEFIAAFQQLAALATKAGVEGGLPRPCAADRAVQGGHHSRGPRLGVDYAPRFPAIRPTSEGRACGRCDSCRLRRDGFAAAGMPIPPATGPVVSSAPSRGRPPGSFPSDPRVVAQSVEHRTFNPLVEGSIPSHPTIH